MIPIEVHIATYGDRIVDLHHRLPEFTGVKYRIVHQNYHNCQVASLKNRSDVDYIQSNAKGVSRSRNAALMLSDPNSIVLLSDDDVSYSKDIFDCLRVYFKSSEIDFCTFKVGLMGNENSDMLDYSDTSHLLTWKNVGKYGAVNLAFRGSFAHIKGLCFDPSFGPGSEFGIGEDYIFIQDLLRAGGYGVFKPDRLVFHPELSTGTSMSISLLEDRGAMFVRAHGLLLGLLVILGFITHKYGFKFVPRTLLSALQYTIKR